MERVWLAYANTNKFDAITCFRTLKHSNWKMGSRHFSEGDIIYFYVSSEKKVMFKTRVIAINLYQEAWDDDEFWSEKERRKAKGKSRMILNLLGEYEGDALDEDRLRLYGMPEKKSSLQQPVYGGNLLECINYIRENF